MTAEMTSPACLSNSRRGSVLLHVPRGSSGFHAYTCQKPEVIRDSVTVLHPRIYTYVCACRATSHSKEKERERESNRGSLLPSSKPCDRPLLKSATTCFVKYAIGNQKVLQQFLPMHYEAKTFCWPRNASRRVIFLKANDFSKTYFREQNYFVRHRVQFPIVSLVRSKIIAIKIVTMEFRNVVSQVME